MHFLELPREIRDLIYKSALCSPLGCGVGNPHKQIVQRYLDKRNLNKLALLAVCRQIHTEALPIFFNYNVFYVFTDDFCHLVTERNAQYIRFISLSQRSFLLAPGWQDASYQLQFHSALKRLSQLEYLNLRLRVPGGFETRRITAQNSEDAVGPLSLTSRYVCSADVAGIFKANQ